MPHIFLLSGVSAAFLFAAAPIPQGADTPLYFPTRTGSKWVYIYPGPSELTEAVTEAKDVSEVDGPADKKTAISVTWDYGEKDGARLSERVVVSSRGLFVMENGIHRFKPPVQWVKANAKAGESWNVDSLAIWKNPDVVGAYQIKGTITFVGTEKVKVPAGEFTALRMEAKGALGWKETRWYVAGVGIVKWINNARTIELKAFTLGR